MLELARFLPDKVQESSALAWLGCDRWQANQLDFAVYYFNQRLTLAKSANNTAAQKETLGWLVSVSKQLGKDTAMPCPYMMEQIELFRQLGETEQERSTCYDLALWQFNLKQYQEAVESFVLAANLGEKINKADAYFMLGQSYRLLEQQQEASENYQKAADLYVENDNQEWAIKSLDYLGQIHKNVKDYEKAIDSQKKRLELLQKMGDRKNEQTALYRLGCVYENNQQYSQAIEYLTSALTLANELKQKGNAANAHYMLGSAYEQLEQLDEAIAHYREAERLYTETKNQQWVENSRVKLQKLEEKNDPTNPNNWLKRAIELINLAQYQDAITCLESAIQLEPNHPEAWLQKTYAFWELKQYPEALESSKRALDLNPNNVMALILRGAILANGFEMYVEALDVFNQALLIDGQNEDAIKNRELMRSKLSDLGFSQEEISQPEKIPFLFDLNNPQDCQKLGDFRKSQGKYREALLMYQRVLSMNPNDDDLWREKGNILWQLGEFQSGCDVYQKAIELNPNNIENYLAFGNNLLSKEINEGALACFNNVLRLTAMKSWKGWVGRGDALLNLGEYKEALDSFVQGIMRQGVSSTSLDYQEGTGALYYSLGCAHVREARKQEDSRDYWEKAQKCFQTSLPYFTNPNWQFDEWLLRLWQDLIPVERELGNTKAARKILYDAIELLNRLMQDELCKHEKERLSKEWSKLKQYHTDDLAQYKTLFLELLDGVDEDWNQEQVLEYLGEHRDDPYLIRWLNSFGRAELEKSWGTPDFDRGYLMMKLGDMDCGEVSQVSQNLGYQMVEKTIKKAQEEIENIYQKYQSGNYKDARSQYLDSGNYWTYDYRIFQSCCGQHQEKLEHIEEGLVSRYADTPTEADDHLAWFNLGEDLKNLEYDQPAIIAFCRTLRLTKGQLWLAWASWGYIELKRPVNPPGITAIGLKCLRRNRPDYKDACGVIHEIQGDYYQEGFGVLYEIQGDFWYGYEHIKGPSRGTVPIDVNNGMLPDYTVWRRWWEKAYDCYRKALDCFTTPRLQERRLGVFQKLVKICRCLGKKDEGQYFEQEGSDLLGRLLQDLTSEEARILLARKFAGFDQYRVDSLANEGKFLKALQFAEWRKNLCLRWLSSNQWSKQSPNLDEESTTFLANNAQPFLTFETAIIYWHISPAAITLFILKGNDLPGVKVLKNEQIYKMFADPQPFYWFLSAPTVTKEDFIQGTSGVYNNQLVRLESWIEGWKSNYSNYRFGKKKEPDEPSDESTDKNSHPANHPWREKMIEELDKLAEVLQIDDIVRDYLADIKKLILVPHRDLHLLPLEYLFRDKGFAISRLPSLQLGLGLQDWKASTVPPVSIEEPETSMGLNFAKIESSILAHRYQIPKDNRIRGKDATHRRILQAIRVAADILHFTGHGEHDLDSPGDSALILANEDKLTLRQILSLPLREYYLVCLSACETGLTSTSNLLDEFVGLVSAFLAKKTAFVLSTLWTVEQISTALLVIKFYQGIQAGVHPAIALRDAQDKLRTLTYSQLAQWYDELATEITMSDRGCAQYLKRTAGNIRKNPTLLDSNEPPFAHPYYWAGFTITGKFS
ncbi:tetratricopeptide repeat protein [Laspinema sp. D1]|nr:tetratricopeptide repeat protein [Laspinema sp. D2b]